MGNVYSNSPTPLSNTSETMPDFNNYFQECVPKMMRVNDDLHRMVDYIKDLNNMMIIGLAILTIIGILILIIGVVLLTIIGILIFLVLKRRNGKQERRGPQTPSLPVFLGFLRLSQGDSAYFVIIQYKRYKQCHHQNGRKNLGFEKS